MKPVLQWENSSPHVLHFLHQIQEHVRRLDKDEIIRYRLDYSKKVQAVSCKKILSHLKGKMQLI